MMAPSRTSRHRAQINLPENIAPSFEFLIGSEVIPVTLRKVQIPGSLTFLIQMHSYPHVDEPRPKLSGANIQTME